MRKFIDLFAIIMAVIAMVLTLNLYLGVNGDNFMGEDGMAVKGVQLTALVSVLAALTLGFAGRFLDRRVPKPATRAANGAIAVGLICGALILAMPFLFA
jgi:hypothetical protein